jgi:hypothetical protein
MIDKPKMRVAMGVTTADGGECMITMTDGHCDGGGFYTVEGVSSLDMIALGVALWEHENEDGDMPIRDILGAAIAREDYSTVELPEDE